jgi:hypothetical protein
MIAEAVLTVELQHKAPVELGELSASLTALAESYARYVESQGIAADGDAVRLYIREIRSGSVIADLVAMAGLTPAILDYGTTVTRSVVGFARSLKDLIDFFSGSIKAAPEGMTKRDADDLGRILQPVIQDSAGAMNIIAREGSTVQVNIALTSDKAAGVKARADHYVAMQRLPDAGVRQGVLFYWHQARGAAAATTGDRGVIESIARGPVKVRFANTESKEAMLGEALFRKAYVVDVNVETIAGKPTLYTILRVIESFDREGAA